MYIDIMNTVVLEIFVVDLTLLFSRYHSMSEIKMREKNFNCISLHYMAFDGVLLKYAKSLKFMKYHPCAKLTTREISRTTVVFAAVPYEGGSP